MTANRDELRRLIDNLPDDQVDVVLADVRRLNAELDRPAVAPPTAAIAEDDCEDDDLGEEYGAGRS